MSSKLRTFYVVLSIISVITALGFFPWSGDATARVLWSFCAVVCSVLSLRDE